MKKKVCVLFIVFIFLLCFSVSASAKSAADYSYTVTPLIKGFNTVFYVKTDNPDVSHIRFKDNSSTLYEASERSSKGIMTPVTRKFADVVYEKSSTLRVKGGYLFESDGYVDGATLVLQVTDDDPEAYDATYRSTSVTVSCSRVTSASQYLINNYTDPAKSFFDNLDAVQSALGSMAVYPKGVYDNSSAGGGAQYPFLAASPYPELGLNEHYEIYEKYSGGILLEYAYPYVLDSMSFPNMIASVAKKLKPACTVSENSVHWLREITLNGKSRSYGGAGTGSTNDIYVQDVTKIFKFDGSSGDYSVSPSLSKLRSKYQAWGDKGDAFAAELFKQIDADSLLPGDGGGTWAKIQVEGWGESFAYAYVMPGYDGKSMVSVENAWVDGRYINSCNEWYRGATFAAVEKTEEPSIIIRNLSYKDRNGVSHRQDAEYIYFADSDSWKAIYNYTGGTWYSSTLLKELPDELVLTRAEVKAMDLDKNTDKVPQKGVYCDGYHKPGTTFDYSKYKWSLTSAGTLTISGTGAMPDYNRIEEIPWDTSAVKKIVVMDGITSIGDYSFYNCKYAFSVSLPESLTKIGDKAFYGCAKLKSVSLPPKLKTIGDSAFEDCVLIDSITVPDTVTKIGDSVFCGDKGLLTIRLSKNLTAIPASAFAGCTKVKELVIPSKVTSIGTFAFTGADSLKRIRLPKSITTFESCAFYQAPYDMNVGYTGTDSQWAALKKKFADVDYALPYGTVSCIGNSSITYSFTEAGSLIFSGTGRLCPYFIDEALSERLPQVTNVIVKSGITSIDGGVFTNNYSLKKITLPSTLTVIRDEAFEYCTNLKTINLPDSLKKIGDRAFSWCESLTEVKLPDSVTGIGKYAFCDCRNLKSISFSKAMTTIPAYSCEYCSALEKVIIPEGVKKIEPYAFLDSNLNGTKVYLPNTVTYVGKEAFPYGKLVLAYYGTKTQYENIDVKSGNKAFTDGTLTCRVKAELTAVTNVGTGIRLRWKEDTKAAGYRIYRKVGDGSFKRVKAIDTNTTLTWIDTGAKENFEEYQYRIVKYYKLSTGQIYTSPASKTVKLVRVPTPTVSKAESTEKGKLSVSWTRNKAATGYEIMYGKSSDLSDGKTAKYGGTATKPVRTLTKLASGKYYYVKLRAYKTVDGVKYYSGWSSVKKVKIK